MAEFDRKIYDMFDVAHQDQSKVVSFCLYDWKRGYRLTLKSEMNKYLLSITDMF